MNNAQIDFDGIATRERRTSAVGVYRTRVELDFLALVVATSPEDARRAALAYTSASLATGGYDLVHEDRTDRIALARELQDAAEDIQRGRAFAPLVVAAGTPGPDQWPDWLAEWQALALTPYQSRDDDPPSVPIQWREPAYSDRERATLDAAAGLGDPATVLRLARELADVVARAARLSDAPGWNADDAEFCALVDQQLALCEAIMVGVEGGVPDSRSDSHQGCTGADEAARNDPDNLPVEAPSDVAERLRTART